MHLLDVCLIIVVSAVRFGLGFTYDALKFSCHMFMHFSCIHTSLFIFLWFEIVFLFCLLSLSLSLTNRTALWHPNRENPFRLETLFKAYPLRLFLLFHLTSGSMMRRPRRTSLRASKPMAFIWNARSFCWISTTLRYPMSFDSGIGISIVRYPVVFI